MTPQRCRSFMKSLSRWAASSLGRELVNHGVLVRLTGVKDDFVLPGRNVDRVRKLLRLEAQAGVLRVHCTLALVGAIHEVAGVELDTRLIGFQRHHAARFG